MRLSNLLLVGVAACAVLAIADPASAADPIGKGLVMYMQMGGNPGDGATLARQTGAAEAAAAMGVELKAQFSAWAPETMIKQFKEAMAAKPNCIEIMGHPGGTAFHDLVKQATDQGTVVTDGNSPLTDLQMSSHERVRLCRRRSLRRRCFDRQGDVGQGPEGGRRGDGLWCVQPG